MLTISNSAERELTEMLEEYIRHNKLVEENSTFTPAIFLQNTKDTYDNKRGENGENVFYIASQGGWKIGCLPIDRHIPKHLIHDINGIKFVSSNIPDAELDFINNDFFIDGEKIKSSRF
ncbi:MAG: hypothetical protein HND53_07245 [Proteobacteria bacterium]|nr:hypothetical protein [Pseudomonadota bacterium]NOG60278.1 hypothetical protein [Pseudomonadota bacterium]